MTVGPSRPTVSPRPLAEDRRSDGGRDLPSRTDAMGAALSEAVGGPVGRRALIGRTRVHTASGDVRDRPRLAGAGLVHEGGLPADHRLGAPNQRVANWDNQRAYYELCYSDTVPLYGAELLSQGKFPRPSRAGWNSTPQVARRPSTTAVRRCGTWSIRRLTGVYQYVAMSLAKTYTLVAVATGWPVLNGVAEVVMFFNIAAFGLALAWLATV